LGDYAGMAVAFLRAGASAVIAPLWSIDDESASRVALSFYDRAISESREAPAEVLREVRREYLNDRAASTPLAYQFFGHPSYRVEYLKEPV
jgi:CHAT domain-containing protein